MSVREWVKQWQKREDRATAVSASKWGKKESGDRESGSSSPPLLCTSASFSGSAYYRSSRFDSVNSTICQYRLNQFCFTISAMSSSISSKILTTTSMFLHGPISIWKFSKYRYIRRISVLILVQKSRTALVSCWRRRLRSFSAFLDQQCARSFRVSISHIELQGARERA